MRISPILLLTLPSIANAFCEYDEILLQKERKEDLKNHGCRNCKSIPISIDACPDIGYDCHLEWPLTTNMLTSFESCRCAEARCFGSTKLAVDKNIIGCNNSHWIVGDADVKSVVCSKPCDIGVCKSSNERAPTDFKPLLENAADAQNRCATGTCEPEYSLFAINNDGSILKSLDLVSTVSCSGDGFWLDSGNQYKYIMCKKSTCANTCNLVPLPVEEMGLDPKLLTPAQRQGCSFSCPANLALLRFDEERSIWGKATCESNGKYKSSDAPDADQIGCYKCPNEDGVLPVAMGGDEKAIVTNCVLHCNDGYALIVTYLDSTTLTVDRLYWIFVMSVWYDVQASRMIPPGIATFKCQPI